MNFKKKAVGVEITQRGIYVCSQEGKLSFESLDQLREFSKNKKLGIAVGRDILLVRKYLFPAQAVDDLLETVMLNIEDLFPTKVPLKVSVLTTSREKDNIECLVFAVPQSLFEELMSFPNLKFVVPSPALYVGEKTGIFYRKLGDTLYERIVIKDGKLIDSILTESVENGSYTVEDIHSASCLAMEALLENKPIDPVFYDKRRFLPVKLSRKSTRLLIAGIFFILLAVGMMAKDIYQLKSKLQKTQEEIEKLKPLAERYEIKRKEIDTKNAVLNVLKSKGFVVSFANFVEMLPPKTKILSVSYDRKSITVEGYTPSAPALIQTIQNKCKDLQVQTSNLQPPHGQSFKIMVGSGCL
ncbi:PilN domain-containing protein [Hydrogenobacter hydrogenophilus]|uniref:Uncharacterized protein n=1 Tax=Hydrogenobacter hydrogenophilus TaxID=35835 RepID=A0A285NWW4_9AQUI|nr:hypothetical protein [Hydrogenobacter hydrogenophilus]SNZ13929.1 hypothetical protein SAMN06265353_0926 [Hydrogenobacter hydrogenophilus]